MKTILIILLLHGWTGFEPEPSADQAVLQTTDLVIDEFKVEAFKVLDLKCNSCHRKQNPGKVFTLDNMDSFSGKINNQVFEKKRMPKGKDNTLSTQESAALSSWLKELNN